MEKPAARDRLQSFFFDCARKSFWDLGLHDHTVIEYVARMLAAFAHSDQLYRLHRADGHKIDSLVEILHLQLDASAAPQPRIQRERALRQYVGDYTLFMSGVFRSSIEKTGVLDYYMQEGQRSYWKVSELDLSLYQTGFLLFQDLSKNFEYYSGALDYMRKACFAPSGGDNPFGQFLRQVEGWMKIGLSQN
jgi:hypothetical protein